MLLLAFIILVFIASLLHTPAGFGFPLLVTPFVAIALGFPVAVPLVALLGLTLYGINLVRYRIQVDLDELLPLGMASVIGIPIGIWALVNIDEKHVKLIIGLIVISYALFALISPRIPELSSRRWAYLASFVAGCLSGAYNSPGLPVVVYGALRQWSKVKFRPTLQVILLIDGMLTVLFHGAAAHITDEILNYYWIGIPALVVGILIAGWAGRRVDKECFRLLVTCLVMVLGIVLILDNTLAEAAWATISRSLDSPLRHVNYQAGPQ